MQIDAPLSPQGVRIGRFLFLGPAGSGKTTIAGHFVRDVLQWPAECIRSVAPPSKPTLSRLARTRHLPLSVTDREAQEAMFGRIWREAQTPYDQGGMDIGLIVDDADFYMSGAGRNYGCPSLSEIVKLGREAGLSQVFVAQGSAAVSKDLIANSSMVAVAATDEPNLLDYARRYMQDVPKAEWTIAHLPRHVFLVYLPSSRPKLAGLWKLVNGRIEVREWLGEDAPQGEESTPTMPNEEPDTPAEAASSPDAPGASPPGTGETGATSTRPRVDEKPTGSGAPGPER